MFDDFDKNFDRDFNRVSKFAIGWFIFVAVLTSLFLGGVGFVVFKVLVHFGIM